MKNARRLTMVIVPMSALAACSARQIAPEQTLTIRWQRLVDDAGETCERCALTQREVRLAADVLWRSLRPLNVKVALKEVPMSPEEVARNTAQSNRIWLNDRTLEDWLGAKVGMSCCDTTCAELGEKAECRTLVVGDQTYEAIPALLIVRAGLLAAEVQLAKQLLRQPLERRE